MPQAGQSAFGLGNLLGGFLRVLTGSAVGLRSFGGLKLLDYKGLSGKIYLWHCEFDRGSLGVARAGYRNWLQSFGFTTISKDIPKP